LTSSEPGNGAKLWGQRTPTAAQMGVVG
jgi:hypothetical protein